MKFPVEFPHDHNAHDCPLKGLNYILGEHSCEFTLYVTGVVSKRR